MGSGGQTLCWLLTDRRASTPLLSVPNNYISHVTTDYTCIALKIKNRIEKYSFSNTFKFQIKVTYIKSVNCDVVFTVSHRH